MKKFVVMTTMALCSMFSPLTGVGQELNCAVEINTDKVQNANKEVTGKETPEVDPILAEMRAFSSEKNIF